MVGFRELTGWWAYGGTRRVVCLERAWKLTPTPYLVLCVSSIWLLLSYILYKKLVNTFLSSVSHSSKLSTFYFLFYWSIVHLQCCVNFYYTSKWFSYTYICIYIYFYILFHYDLSQVIEYSFLCYTVGPCCLSILYVIVCISNKLLKLSWGVGVVTLAFIAGWSEVPVTTWTSDWHM